MKNHKFIYGSVFVLMLFMSACNKEKRNERQVAGVWGLDRITTTVFDANGNETSQDTLIEGAVMQLQNSDALYNYAYFENWQPFGTGSCLWDVNFGKLRELNFHFEDGFANYNFTIDKCTRKKMELSIYIADDSLNLDQKTTYFFTKQ